MPTDIANIGDLLGLETTQFVCVSYQMMLGREPEPRELDAHKSALRLGHGRPRLLADIARSPEYEARQTALFAHGDDSEFVTHLYQAFLGRRPEPDGLETYLGLLRSGRSRAQIRSAVSRSSEARFAGTFWSELQRLLDEEKKGSRGLSRWFGRRKALARSRNRDLELAYGQLSEIEALVSEVAGQVSTLKAQIAMLGETLVRLKDDSEILLSMAHDANAKDEATKITISKIEASVDRSSLEARQHRQTDLHDDRKWRNTVEATLARIEANVNDTGDRRVRARHLQLNDPSNEVNVVHVDALGSKSKGVILRMQASSRISTNPRDDIDAFDN